MKKLQIENIAVGKEYAIAFTGPIVLNTLQKGETVRAVKIVDSIVTNEPTFVRVRVTNENSENYDIEQIVFPYELMHLEDYARIRRD